MTAYRMVQECVDSYHTEESSDGIDIHIKVPKRFADLWLTKLSELEATDDEIKEYRPRDPVLRLT
jgi:hypothetical protein